MEILAVVLGVAVVLLVGLIFLILRRDNSQGLDDRLKLEFQSLTQSALKESREELERELSRHASVGSQELEGKKALIDQQLYNIKAELARVADLVRVLERDREAKFGQLTEQIKNVGEQAAALTCVHGHAPGSAGQQPGAGAVGGADGRGYSPADGFEGGGELPEAGNHGGERVATGLQLSMLPGEYDVEHGR